MRPIQGLSPRVRSNVQISILVVSCISQYSALGQNDIRKLLGQLPTLDHCHGCYGTPMSQRRTGHRYSTSVQSTLHNSQYRQSLCASARSWRKPTVSMCLCPHQRHTLPMAPQASSCNGSCPRNEKKNLFAQPASASGDHGCCSLTRLHMR
jgi:hypothetical protein